MKWLRVAYWIVRLALEGVRRGWLSGKVEVSEQRQRELFERANSMEEMPLDKRSDER